MGSQHVAGIGMSSLGIDISAEFFPTLPFSKEIY